MEQPVQQRGLKREFRLADLVLMQVLLIVGLGWVGTVGVEGSALPFQIVPITGVTDHLGFALKVGGLICAINALGAWLYWRGAKRLAASQHLLNVR